MNLPLSSILLTQKSPLFETLSGQLPTGAAPLMQHALEENGLTFSSLLTNTEQSLNLQQTILAMSSNHTNRTLPTLYDAFENEVDPTIEQELAGLFQALNAFLERYLPNSSSTNNPITGSPNEVIPNPKQATAAISPLPTTNAVLQTNLRQQTSLLLNPIHVISDVQLQSQDTALPPSSITHTQTDNGLSLDNFANQSLYDDTTTVFPTNTHTAVSNGNRLSASSQPNHTLADERRPNNAFLNPPTFKNLPDNTALSNNRTLLASSQPNHTLADERRPNNALLNPSTFKNLPDNTAVTAPWQTEPASSVNLPGQITEMKGSAVTKQFQDLETSRHQAGEADLSDSGFNIGLRDARDAKMAGDRTVATSSAPRFTILPPDKAVTVLGTPLPPNRLLLQIQPPELGHIQVEIQLANDQLAAVFWAESPEVRNLLHNHLAALHQALLEQNFQPGRITIAVTADGFAHQDGQPSQEHASPQFTPLRTPPQGTDESSLQQVRELNELQHNADSLLNIII